MTLLRRAPMHPLLLALYPGLALLAHNIEQIRPSAAWRSLIISIIGSGLLFLLLKLVLHSWRRAAIVCSFALVLFFSYGHINQSLKLTGSLGITLARHRYMLPLWSVLFGIGTWWLIKRLQNLSEVTLMMNVAALLMVLMPMVKLGVFSYRAQTAQTQAFTHAPDSQKLRASGDKLPPDIYYIVLDAYTRQDILREVFDYDNSPFLDALTEMGFYVARCSQSNYAQTELSLASTFNLNYLDELGDGFVAGSTDRSGLWPLLRHGKVRSMLEDLGYKIVAFDTGFYWIMWQDADVYLSPPREGSNTALLNFWGLNGFEAMFLRSTAALVLTDAALKIDLLDRLLPDVDYPRKIWRDKALFTLEQLGFEKVPSIQGPKFVYAHLILPHPPYVFGPDGEYVEERLDDMDVTGYRNQLIFTNKQVEPILRGIIDRSEHKPVIILQGDHGLRFAPRERMAILNAYYLPDGGSEQLYPTISPVNSFRLIFDAYFGGEYGLLEDASYFSKYDRPYDYQLVPSPESGCELETQGE
jgi:hypothetical protein